MSWPRFLGKSSLTSLGLVLTVLCLIGVCIALSNMAFMGVVTFLLLGLCIGIPSVASALRLTLIWRHRHEVRVVSKIIM